MMHRIAKMSRNTLSFSDPVKVDINYMILVLITWLHLILMLFVILIYSIYITLMLSCYSHLLTSAYNNSHAKLYTLSHLIFHSILLFPPISSLFSLHNISAVTEEHWRFYWPVCICPALHEPCDFICTLGTYCSVHVMQSFTLAGWNLL